MVVHTQDQIMIVHQQVGWMTVRRKIRNEQGHSSRFRNDTSKTNKISIKEHTVQSPSSQLKFLSGYRIYWRQIALWSIYSRFSGHHKGYWSPTVISERFINCQNWPSCQWHQLLPECRIEVGGGVLPWASPSICSYVESCRLASHWSLRWCVIGLALQLRLQHGFTLYMTAVYSFQVMYGNITIKIPLLTHIPPNMNSGGSTAGGKFHFMSNKWHIFITDISLHHVHVFVI